MELGTAFVTWSRHPLFGTSFLCVTWGDVPELITGCVYLNNPFGEGLPSLPQETSGIVPNHGRCPRPCSGLHPGPAWPLRSGQ